MPFRLYLLNLFLHSGNVDSLIVSFRSTFVSSRSVTRQTFSSDGGRTRRKGEVSEGVSYRLVKLTDV